MQCCCINAITQLLFISLPGRPRFDMSSSMCLHLSVYSVVCAISHSLALTHLSNNYLYFLHEIVSRCCSIVWLACLLLWLIQFIVRIKLPHFRFLAFLCGWLFLLWLSSPRLWLSGWFIIALKRPTLVSQAPNSNMFAVMTLTVASGGLDPCANRLYQCYCG